MPLQFSKMSLSSPPDPQDLLAVMVSVGYHRNQDPGAVHPETLPNLLQRSELTSKHLLTRGTLPMGMSHGSPAICHSWSLPGHLLQRRGLSGGEAVCPSSAAASQLPLQGLCSSVLTTVL